MAGKLFSSVLLITLLMPPQVWAVECPGLIITGGTGEWTGTNEGDTVTYTCSGDWTFPDGTTSRSHTCQSDGHWSGTIESCYQATNICSEIPMYTGAQNEYSGFNLGDTLTMTCGSIFRFPDGTTIRYYTCQLDGTWGGGTMTHCFQVGDVNIDHYVDLKDAILSLQICTGETGNGSVGMNADANNDQKIGLAESVYILHELSGL